MQSDEQRNDKPTSSVFMENSSFCKEVSAKPGTKKLITRKPQVVTAYLPGLSNKNTFLKKASFSRLKWIKPAKILCFFKHRIFSKMRHGSSSNQYKYAEIMLIFSAR